MNFSSHDVFVDNFRALLRPEDVDVVAAPGGVAFNRARVRMPAQPRASIKTSRRSPTQHAVNCANVLYVFGRPARLPPVIIAAIRIAITVASIRRPPIHRGHVHRRRIIGVAIATGGVAAAIRTAAAIGIDVIIGIAAVIGAARDRPAGAAPSVWRV